MANESFQRSRTNYESNLYKEISTEEFISLYEKNPESFWDSHVIPPSLGSEGYGKIFVNFSRYKEYFNEDINRIKPESEEMNN